ncbi:hypothetical protein [Nocardiopsis sp. CNT312]|uniref:hypothetical protein n=1 Tax=Nocardiopsis sp. CNT312 TaxID=1137268 RepID=UPI00048C2864|nr:hypothetical protein [Nocardiopsis sp. CNT312]
MTPETPGLWARVFVRALVVVAAGVMALGFLGPGEGLLIAGLTTLTYVLMWLRGRTPGVPEPRRAPEPGGGEPGAG